MGSSPHLWFCACKTATLAPELLDSMCPSPHLWFLHAKQRILGQNFKSLWFPYLIEACYSAPEDAVLHAITTGEVFDAQRLEILVLKSLFCMHKTTGEGWKQYSLFILVLSTQVCVLKTTDGSQT